MLNTRRFVMPGILALVVALLLSATGGIAATQASNAWRQPHREVMQVELAQDMTSFAFTKATTSDPAAAPAFGDPFIIEGYLYPAGTLTESNGINPDGSPEFPEKVIGTWTCIGWFVGEGLATTTGPWAVSTQLFSFGDQDGTTTITTEGYETPDLSVIHRAITGGTGAYIAAIGEQTQQRIGRNATGASNFTIELTLVKQ